MVEIFTTADFDNWLRKLRDRSGRARILLRIDRLRQGNFGDAKPVGRGVSELKFAFGPGYRVYYAKRGDQVLLLLCGGDKSSQASDILKARDLAVKWYAEEVGETL